MFHFDVKGKLLSFVSTPAVSSALAAIFYRQHIPLSSVTLLRQYSLSKRLSPTWADWSIKIDQSNLPCEATFGYK